MFEVVPGTHRVKDTEVARFLRRELREPTLFTMWHCQSQKWCLCYWIHEGHHKADLIQEAGDVFEKGPQISPEDVSTLRLMHRTPDFQRIKKRLVAAEQDELRKMDEATNDMRDLRAFIKKRTGNQVYFQ